MESLQPSGANMPYMKIEDTQYFSKLLEDIDEEMLPAEEQKEREIMRMLLKIKNGTPPMRKVFFICLLFVYSFICLVCSS